MQSQPLTGEDGRETLLIDLFTAIMAVNRWTVERAYSVSVRLKAVGLLDLPAMSSMSVDDVSERLGRAGYDRGEFMLLQMAERMLSMVRALENGGLEKVETLETSRRLGDIRDFLLTIKGVGPAVVNCFFIMREMKNPSEHSSE
jgi:hypothetical protein